MLLPETEDRTRLRVFTAACARGTAVRLISVLRFSVVCRVESGTLEDDPGTCSHHSFSLTSTFGAFSLSCIFHLMKFIKPVTAIAASVFVSWHSNPFQTLSIIVIALDGHTFTQAEHPKQPRLTRALPLTSILILR